MACGARSQELEDVDCIDERPSSTSPLQLEIICSPLRYLGIAAAATNIATIAGDCRSNSFPPCWPAYWLDINDGMQPYRTARIGVSPQQETRPSSLSILCSSVTLLDSGIVTLRASRGLALPSFIIADRVCHVFQVGGEDEVAIFPVQKHLSQERSCVGCDRDR